MHPLTLSITTYLKDAPSDFLWIIVMKRRPANNQFVCENSEGPDINFFVIWAEASLLKHIRRHARRLNGSAGHGRGKHFGGHKVQSSHREEWNLNVLLYGGPEISKTYGPISVEQNIFRLNISMDEGMFRVQAVQGLKQRKDDGRRSVAFAANLVSNNGMIQVSSSAVFL
jgi:hypothetical protein